MNKTLAITAIVLVAIVMGMSTIAPALAYQAEADNHPGGKHKVTPDKCKQIERALTNANVDKRLIIQILVSVGCI